MKSVRGATDLRDAIRQLKTEKEKLEIVIVELERLQIAAADDADANVKAGTKESLMSAMAGR